MGWLSTFKDEWRVIADAPWSFAAVLAAATGIMWLVLRALKAQEIADLKGRLQLRDDQIADYKAKLNGATPDEAKARFAELEALVAPMRPRELTDRQALIITRAIAGIPPASIGISYYSDPVCRDYAVKLRTVFNGAGWPVEMVQVLGLGGKSVGLVVVLPGGEVSPQASKVMSALSEAGIEYQRSENDRLDQLAFRLLVSPRA